LAYTLLLTDSYKQDLDRLPKIIREKKVPKFINFLQTNPDHPGINTHPQIQLKDCGVNRSNVDDYYRCLWRYDGQRTICLHRILSHKEADAIDTIKVGDPIAETITPHIVTDNISEEIAPRPAAFQRSEEKIFNNVDDTLLQLFGFSESQIKRICSASSWEEISALSINERKYELLEEIFTSGFGPETLITFDQVLYRTNADNLIHYCQGKIKSLMLNLNGEQEKAAYAQNEGVTLIKGVAGSGKTTIGIYRALHLARQDRLFSKKPILFLTYNQTLANVISRLFEELLTQEEIDRLKALVKVNTLREWAKGFLSDKLDFRFNMKTAESLLTKAMGEQVEDEVLKQFLVENSFLVKEVSQVIKGRDIRTEEEYLQTKRFGMGKALQKDRRKIIWKIYKRYIEVQKEKKIWDECDLYLESLNQISNLTDFEPYNEVIVDEAQDLPPTALQLCAKLAGGGDTKGLTLLADPNQSIYYKGIPWLDGGIKIHGSRVSSLRKNFRNSRQILEAAWDVIKDDENHPEEMIEPDKALRIGRKPIHYVTPHMSDQQKKAIKEIIIQLHQSNEYRLGDMAILVRFNDSRRREDVDGVASYLRHQNIPVSKFRDGDFDVFDNKVKVITYHSAKGLEFPVVILFDVNEGTFPLEHIPNIIDDDEREMEMRIERHLLYVGMTRASELLYIISSEGHTSRFIKVINSDLLNNSTVF
jgi:superfamily I DNA/RNA helicase/mRNA-degrading endonuclease RelE of RelBE toxin-antitoxin system